MHESDTDIESLRAQYPFLDAAWAGRLLETYGAKTRALLGDARSLADLGQSFGASLTEREVLWLQNHEHIETLQGILWQRTKLGAELSPEQHFTLAAWLCEREV